MCIKPILDAGIFAAEVSLFAKRKVGNWSKMDAKSKDFDKLLLGSIDDALGSLGESAKQSVYSHIERNYKVVRNEIPANLQQFQEGLEKIFGIGARLIEILIMKNLYAKIGHPLVMEKNQHLEFIKYVNVARLSCLKECHDEEKLLKTLPKNL